MNKFLIELSVTIIGCIVAAIMILYPIPSLITLCILVPAVIFFKRYRDKKQLEAEMLMQDLNARIHRLLLEWAQEQQAMQVTNVQDSFDLLKLSPDASVQEIKAQFRKLAHESHPDKGGDKEQFQKLIQAKNACLQFRGEKI